MEKKIPAITSSSFIYRALLGLHHLQGIPEFHEGVRLQDLTTYIKANCLTDGDVHHQTETALIHSIGLGYVRKFNDKYQVIVNSAKIQQVPCGSLEQTQEIARVLSIFSTNWLSGQSFQNYVQKEQSIKLLNNITSDVPVQIDEEVNIPKNSNNNNSTTVNKKILKNPKKRPKTSSDASSVSSLPISTSSKGSKKSGKRKKKKRCR